MKRLPALASSVGFCTVLLCSTGFVSYAQKDHQKGRSEEHKKGDDHRGRDYPAPRSKEQARGWQRQNDWRRNAWQGSNSWNGHRTEQWQNQRRTWAQRGGYGGYYIQRDRFDHYFGPQHMFRIRTRPTIVGGYPRFQYGGYQFMMADPWPASWPQNWYSTDDVYVDYGGDGYYLYNRRDPGFSFALSIVM